MLDASLYISPAYFLTTCNTYIAETPSGVTVNRPTRSDDGRAERKIIMKNTNEMRAVNRYEVTFNQPEFNAVYEIIREKSAAFAYGNGSTVIVLRNGKRDNLIDTRYDRDVMEDFDRWCDIYINNCFAREFEPVIKKI